MWYEWNKTLWGVTILEYNILSRTLFSNNRKACIGLFVISNQTFPSKYTCIRIMDHFGEIIIANKYNIIANTEKKQELLE